VVSFTTVANARSRAVMERLGMTRDPVEDFDHPTLDPDSPVLRQVLYRLGRTSWARSTRPSS
jgi:RimJ/RimL family protein N-acetyltransferase